MPGISALSLTVVPFTGDGTPILLPLKLGLLAALVTRSGASSQPSIPLRVGDCLAGFFPSGGSETQRPAKRQMGPYVKSPAPPPPWGVRHQFLGESLEGRVR